MKNDHYRSLLEAFTISALFLEGVKVTKIITRVSLHEKVLVTDKIFTE